MLPAPGSRFERRIVLAMLPGVVMPLLPTLSEHSKQYSVQVQILSLPSCWGAQIESWAETHYRY
jgi:hypothetical protein